MSSAPPRRHATVEDWLAHSDDEHLELIRGTLLEKASPSLGHAEAQGGTVAALVNPFRFGRGGGPGGWRFFTELDVRLGGEVFRPDVCAFRMERAPALPKARPVPVAPDWVCEILSPSHRSTDRVDKQETYFRAGIPHHWLIDPEEGTLEVLRRTDLAYAIVLSARRGSASKPSRSMPSRSPSTSCWGAESAKAAEPD